MGCNRCKGTSSDPNNFLLCCSRCGKNWHHRCHIPPLGDEELVALLRATNDNDVDNGLSSWIGRCCKRKRVPKQATPEASIRLPPSVPVVEVKPHRSPSVSAPLKASTDINPIHEVGTSPLSDPKHLPRRLDQTIRSSDVTTPPTQGDRLTTAYLSFDEPAACEGSQTTLPELDLQYPEATCPNTTPLLPDPESQQVEATHARVSSSLPEHSLVVGGVNHAPTNWRSTGADPPTLDLRALSLNRAPGPSKGPSRLLLHRETTVTSRTSTPPAVPPVKPEDDEMEDLYGPPLGLPSPYAPPPPQRGRLREPSPSLKYPEDSRPLLLPALAAKDPNVLAILERHEQREAARTRRGMRKVQAVRGAGKTRRGFVLVEKRTKAETSLAAERAVARASQWMATINVLDQ